ncbi:MAG: ATP-binding cassette domain-containing protein, partial [Clostridiales bacterium]|nr:ATP-binding cassette domain-containing protein [Clostridiales bacterium]
MEPILRVSGLTKTFSRQGQADFTAVKNISFDLFPGECLAIIGESGSGKTTAVNMIARLVDVTSGSVFLDGEDITNRKGKALREVYRAMQMVFQTPADSFDPRRTLGDGIGESLRNAGLSKKETREKVEALLKDCGLPPEYADRYPHQVSGGQCQRAAIARALAIAP